MHTIALFPWNALLSDNQSLYKDFCSFLIKNLHAIISLENMHLIATDLINLELNFIPITEDLSFFLNEILNT